MSFGGSCLYCLSKLSEAFGCVNTCLEQSEIQPSFPGSMLMITGSLAILLFVSSLYFRKDLKRFIFMRTGSVAFVFTAFFILSLVFNGHFILKKLSILIPIVGLFIYLISHFFSFYFIMLSYRTMPFEAKKKFIKEFSASIGVDVPRLYVVFDKYPRAFSVYGFRKAVFLSDTLIEKLDDCEIDAVLMHELYHLKRKTGVFKNILNSFGNLNFKLFSPPIAELERYEEEEVDKFLLGEFNINMQKIREKL